MSKELLSLVYNAEFFTDERAFLVFVKNMRDIESWTRPFPGLLFFISEAEVSALSETFGEFFGEEVDYFVTILGEFGHGTLAEQSWTWMFNQSEKLGRKLADYGHESDAIERSTQAPALSSDDDESKE